MCVSDSFKFTLIMNLHHYINQLAVANDIIARMAVDNLNEGL